MEEALQGPESLPARAGGFAWRHTAAGFVLVCEPLSDVAIHGWTTRQLELLGAEHACSHHWERLAAAARAGADAVRRMDQVHGTTVLPARAEAPHAPRADGLTSNDPSLVLSVRVADCVPVLLADRRSGAVAAVHAGWRGTAAGIVGQAVEAMRDRYGTRSGEIVAALGPSIGACHYEVGPELEAAFRTAGWPQSALERWFARADEQLRLDVAAANADQLREAGVRPDSIHVSGLCTACHPDWFYSYRRDGAGTGRLVGFIRARLQPAPRSGESASPMPVRD
jgi:polyphenol oxidase